MCHLYAGVQAEHQCEELACLNRYLLLQLLRRDVGEQQCQIACQIRILVTDAVKTN